MFRISVNQRSIIFPTNGFPAHSFAENEDKFLLNWRPVNGNRAELDSRCGCRYTISQKLFTKGYDK